MKVRVKFTKRGEMKFIGHLDMMRYFQKAIRRSAIDIAYSEGYSPHMIMSFAAPLGVGVTSDGEYFDMELRTADSSEKMEASLNAAMANGVEIVSIRKIPEEKASNAMALVAAADYLVRFREGYSLPDNWREKIPAFLAQSEILCMKKTKKGEKEVNIRPWIYEMEAKEDAVFLKLSSGSVRNLKPEQVLSAFAAWLSHPLQSGELLLHRVEIYADLGEEDNRKLVTLEALGEAIE